LHSVKFIYIVRLSLTKTKVIYMHYEINVSLDGQHYFATSKRSITSLGQASAIFEHFSDLFPAKDGYKITVSQWQTLGTEVFKNG